MMEIQDGGYSGTITQLSHRYVTKQARSCQSPISTSPPLRLIADGYLPCHDIQKFEQVTCYTYKCTRLVKFLNGSSDTISTLLDKTIFLSYDENNTAKVRNHIILNNLKRTSATK